MADVRGARIARLINDPEVSGDLLLVGMILAAARDFDGVQAPNVRDIAALAWPDRPSDHAYWRTTEAFRRDIRTYEPPRGDDKCGAPPGPRGGICRRNATIRGWRTDWSTGEMTELAACSKHKAWFDAAWKANRDVKPDVAPLPTANHGGVLAKHFPELNWRKFWSQLDPHWVEHPETKPWPKPNLSLVLGDGDETTSDRPVLVLAGDPA